MVHIVPDGVETGRRRLTYASPLPAFAAATPARCPLVQAF